MLTREIKDEIEQGTGVKIGMEINTDGNDPVLPMRAAADQMRLLGIVFRETLPDWQITYPFNNGAECHSSYGPHIRLAVWDNLDDGWNWIVTFKGCLTTEMYPAGSGALYAATAGTPKEAMRVAEWIYYQLAEWAGVGIGDAMLGADDPLAQALLAAVSSKNSSRRPLQ